MGLTLSILHILASAACLANLPLLAGGLPISGAKEHRSYTQQSPNMSQRLEGKWVGLLCGAGIGGAGIMLWLAMKIIQALNRDKQNLNINQGRLQYKEDELGIPPESRLSSTISRNGVGAATAAAAATAAGAGAAGGGGGDHGAAGLLKPGEHHSSLSVAMGPTTAAAAAATTPQAAEASGSNNNPSHARQVVVSPSSRSAPKIQKVTSRG